jgi:hypothetical protein
MAQTPLRSSVVVVDVAAAHHSTIPPTGTPIPFPSDHVVAVVSTTNNEFNAVELPEDAPLGAVVEVYPGIDGVRVHSPTGENINGVSFHDVSDGNVMFRKVTATRWGRIG